MLRFTGLKVETSITWLVKVIGRTSPVKRKIDGIIYEYDGDITSITKTCIRILIPLNDCIYEEYKDADMEVWLNLVT